MAYGLGASAGPFSSFYAYTLTLAIIIGDTSLNHVLSMIGSLDLGRLKWESLLICEKLLEMKLEETRRLLKRTRRKGI